MKWSFLFSFFLLFSLICIYLLLFCCFYNLNLKLIAVLLSVVQSYVNDLIHRKSCWKGLPHGTETLFHVYGFPVLSFDRWQQTNWMPCLVYLRDSKCGSMMWAVFNVYGERLCCMYTYVCVHLIAYAAGSATGRWSRRGHL